MKNIQQLVSSAKTLISVGSKPLQSRPLAAFLSPLLVAAAIISNPVLAHEGHEGSSDPTTPTFVLPYKDLGTFTSEQGESKKDFMRRVAAYVSDHTKETGWETCGMIQQNISDPKNWRVRLMTNGSQLACVRMLFEEEGYVNTKESIHSHPPTIKIEVSLNDTVLRPNMSCGQKIGVNPYIFSEVDTRHGSGYLVIPGRHFRGPRLLYHSNGRDTDLGALRGTAIPDTSVAAVPNAEELAKSRRLTSLDSVTETTIPVSQGGACKIS